GPARRASHLRVERRLLSPSPRDNYGILANPVGPAVYADRAGRHQRRRSVGGPRVHSLSGARERPVVGVAAQCSDDERIGGSEGVPSRERWARSGAQRVPRTVDAVVQLAVDAPAAGEDPAPGASESLSP